MDTTDTGLIISTTAKIENRPVREYLGIVTGEATMSTANATYHRQPAGRRLLTKASSFEQRVSETRERAIAAMVRHADGLGASAIIAVNINYTTIQQPHGGDLLVITASGSVVTL